MADKAAVFRFADVEVREREFCLVKAGEEFPVEPKTFRVLLYLLRNPQKLIPKEELLNAVWGDAVVTDSSLTRTIAQLRRLLGDEIRNPRYIETVATVGYRFICPVEAIDDSTGKSEAENQTVAKNGRGALATPVDPMVPTVVPEKTKVDGRRRLWLTLGATSVAAALAIGYWYLLRTPPPPRITAYSQISGLLDRRHILSIDYAYRLPFFAKGKGLLRAIAGRWEIAGTSIAETGVVQIVTGAGGVVGSGNTYDPVGLGGGYTVRPNISGRTIYRKKWAQCFDTSMFSNVVPVWQGGANMGFGNAGKDAVVAPSRVNFTTSLYKSFPITEHAHFELRFESFNTFNHSEPDGLNTKYGPQNGAFSTVLSKGNTFGQVSGTFDPRVLEIGGKLVF
jgi:DNA-binding winged helix-turn-helix (wHTH) protein